MSEDAEPRHRRAPWWKWVAYYGLFVLALYAGVVQHEWGFWVAALTWFAVALDVHGLP